MAVLFTEWVTEYLPDRHANVAWLLVFKEIDDDASGLLTFDELRQVIRRIRPLHRRSRDVLVTMRMTPAHLKRRR